MKHHTTRFACTRQTRVALATLGLTLALGANTAFAMEDKACDPRDEAGHGPCFGLELTFTNAALQGERGLGGLNTNTSHQKDAIIQWRKHVIEKCAEPNANCRVEEVSAHSSVCPLEPESKPKVGSDEHSFRVCFFKTGERPWWYAVDYDQAVLEVTTRPSNLRWLRAQEEAGLRKIWDAAEAVKLEPDETKGIGGGHIHIDPQSSFRSIGHLLNFMTRLHNLRVLPLSARIDGTNAPPMSIMGPAMRQLYRTFVQNYWRSELLAMHERRSAFDELMSRLRDEVYLYTYRNRHMHSTIDEVYKATAAYTRLANLISALRSRIGKLPAELRPDWEALKARFERGDYDEVKKRLSSWRQLNPTLMTDTELADTLADADVADELSSRTKYHAVHAHWRYDTIELRSIDPERSPADVLAIVTMLSKAIDSTPYKTRLELDPDIALQGSDDAWKSGARPFLYGTRLSREDAHDIARRFRDFVGDDKLLDQLRPYMPEQIRESLGKSGTCSVM